MNIIVGKTSGFCDGVRFTVLKAESLLEEYRKVYSLGEIVHNEHVIDDLEKNGMIVVDNINKIPDCSKMIIRAHGEVKEVYDKAKEKKLEVFDLTCGKVRAIRLKVEKKKDDYYIVIIGKKNHPESKGVQSFAGNYSFVLENEDEINNLIEDYKKSKKDKIYVVSQTTFNEEKFNCLVDLIKKEISDEIVVDKTICNATSNRQNETRELSKKMDCMIIVGGKNSSNTKELEEVSRENCKNTYLIQDYHDLEKMNFNYKNIGIMAGASTPVVVVDELINYLKNNKKY